MTRQCFALVLLLLCTAGSYAKTITVSNNPNSPGQYTDLQTAINAATANDTLLVSGSSTSYGDITVNKRLTLTGQGYDPRKDLPYPTTVFKFILAQNAGGTSIMGFSGYNIQNSWNVDNITIKRCKYSEITVLNNNGFGNNNWVIAENFIYDHLYIYSASTGFIIRNNIFSYNPLGTLAIISAPATVTNLLISNNHFNGQAYLDVFNAIISNNIFSYKLTSSINFSFLRTGSSGNNTINNNLTYRNTSTNPFNIGSSGNLGGGNILNTDPKLVSYDLSTTQLQPTDNLQLLAGSPAKNAGTDGKDIGVHGGSLPIKYPYSGEPAIPQIKTMTINNTTIAPGGTLNVLLKANSNN